jgi:hypothetical protein
MNIFSHAQYPTPQDWDDICQRKQDSINKIQFEFNNRPYNLLDFSQIKDMEYSYWLREFNNRSFDMITSYVMMMFYYDKGIPDDEWYISPGKTGKSIDYFPHFEERHFIYLYWFGFYMDSYYTKYFSLIDTIYHLVNIRYDLEVPSKLGFKSEISKKLKSVDTELHDFLNSLRNNTTLGKITDFRNNIVHNYRPNQVDSGINTVKRDGQIIEMSFTVGNYTKTSEFVNNINDSLDLMSLIVEKVREKLKQEDN